MGMTSHNVLRSNIHDCIVYNFAHKHPTHKILIHMNILFLVNFKSIMNSIELVQRDNDINDINQGSRYSVYIHFVTVSLF